MRRRNAKEADAERDAKLRDELFKRTLASATQAGRRQRQRYDRQADGLRTKAEKTTEMLNSLVLRMSEQVSQLKTNPIYPANNLIQVQQSEATTATLIHSSAVLKETHSHFNAVGSTIRSGGKLLSKYARRETTDKILIVLALLLYFSVIFYILQRRIPWFHLLWFF